MKLNIREFLNEKGHHSFASIIASIRRNENGVEKDGSDTASVQMMLMDCSKQVSLAFDINNHRERSNSLHKIRTLIEALQQFEETLITEAEYQSGQEKIRLQKQIESMEEQENISAHNLRYIEGLKKTLAKLEKES